MNKQPLGPEHADRPEDAAGDHLQAVSTLAEPDVSALAEWMDAELEKLVARWIHLAAPNACRGSKRRVMSDE